MKKVTGIFFLVADTPFRVPPRVNMIKVPIDKDLIRLLYNPAIETGLNESSVQPVLEQLVQTLKIGV